MALRIGIDLGGTKIEGLVLDEAGGEIIRRRIPTPRGEYGAIVSAITAFVRKLEVDAGARGQTRVGVGIPGTISPATGLVKNANTTEINGHPLDRDLAAALAREVRVQNDANCFALSEATDGAGEGAGVVFGVIIGTGVGGGLVVDGRIVAGRHLIGGEWGHNPLPWPSVAEVRRPAFVARPAAWKHGSPAQASRAIFRPKQGGGFQQLRSSLKNLAIQKYLAISMQKRPCSATCIVWRVVWPALSMSSIRM
jgi:predicted NBD/HSP70 family sugar kinase